MGHWSDDDAKTDEDPDIGDRPPRRAVRAPCLTSAAKAEAQVNSVMTAITQPAHGSGEAVQARRYTKRGSGNIACPVTGCKSKFHQLRVMRVHVKSQHPSVVVPPIAGSRAAAVVDGRNSLRAATDAPMQRSAGLSELRAAAEARAAADTWECLTCAATLADPVKGAPFAFCFHDTVLFIM